MMKDAIKGFILTSLITLMSLLHALAPEGKTAPQVKPLVYGQHAMVVTNNLWASKTANDILKQGGSAVDAAIAASFVLGLTEPQSSGIGGGGYALTYQSKNERLRVYDGREKAPQSATAALFLDANKQPLPLKKAMLSPIAVGIPGEVALLYAMHQAEGKLPWKSLIKPARDLARLGFPMSPRLYHLLKEDDTILIQDASLKAIFFTPQNTVKPIGSLLKNLDYASSLAKISSHPGSFYKGTLARDIRDKINTLAGKKLLTLSDFKTYAVTIQNPLCTKYRKFTLCTTGAESGGTTLLELMKIFEMKYKGHDAQKLEWKYQFLEASKLAFADRNKYSADPAFIPQPTEVLLSQAYIQQRAQSIGTHAQKMPVPAGLLKGYQAHVGSDNSNKPPGTTSLAIVDSKGNAVTMILTIEQQFGSHIFVNGFFLNNELTDFSLTPRDEQGLFLVNRPEALKRPRSGMAPAMVFNKNKQLIGLSGSPGGSQIICYVAKNLIYMLDFKKDPRESAASGNLCSNNDNPLIETNSSLIAAIPGLKRRGEMIKTKDMVSGITNILKSENSGWLGAADPRREGVAIGH